LGSGLEGSFSFEKGEILYQSSLSNATTWLDGVDPYGEFSLLSFNMHLAAKWQALALQNGKHPVCIQ